MLDPHPLITGLVELASSPPPAADVSIIVYLLGAALAGGIGKVLLDVFQRWRKGPLDDGEQIGRTLRNELGGMRELLEQYRIEQEVTKRQLDGYRSQLGDVTTRLAEARVRIEILERDLERAKDRRDSMERELRSLRRQLDALNKQRDTLQGEADDLRARLAQLAAITGTPAPESGGGDIAP